MDSSDGSNPRSMAPLTSSPLLEPIVSLTLPIATKLNSNNYLTWKSHILPIIHGYNLSKFLDFAPPSPTLTTDTGQININPEFLPWHRQDQLLLGWIRSSLTEFIQSQTVSSTTTAGLWSSLHQSFSSSSRARLIDLKPQMQHTTRGSSTCTEYLNKIRQLADELAFIGSLISNELVSNILSGLGSEFNPFFAAITAASRNETFSFSDLQGLLLGFESLLKSQSSSSTISSFSPPPAFAINTSSPAPRNSFNRLYTPRFNNSQPKFRPSQPPQGQYQPSTGFNPRSMTPVIRPPGPTHAPFDFQIQSKPPKAPFQSGTTPKQLCQICNKFKFYSAKTCWFRYNPDTDWVPPAGNSLLKLMLRQAQRLPLLLMPSHLLTGFWTQEPQTTSPAT